MTEEKEVKPISRKSRIYASLIFLVTFVVVAIIWMVFFGLYLQPFENFVTLLIIFIVLGGLALLPWLPLLFPRESPSGPPLEDL